MPRNNVNEQRISRIMDVLRPLAVKDPEVGIVLGTGLGGLADAIAGKTEIPYADLPGFPQSTVQGHSGKLVIGELGGRQVIGFSGRFHYYEGYDMQEMTLPVRIMQSFGVQKIILSNAAGGLNPAYKAGDIVLIHDHINLFPDNPLRGVNAEAFGVRFPDMLHTYDKGLIRSAEKAAGELGIPIHRGIYLGLQGPNLETPAEYRFFHQIGADLVGMSTIPEAIVAKHADIPVVAFSIVSNMCYPTGNLTETHLEDVIHMVNSASEKVQQVVTRFLEKD